ncbi:MAG: glutamate-5-semialdehyde dehydrogenase [SAR324 cluster bacterium]|uniref:Gamma-glutamyl phosphate reductase n=1 Tax=SAR324 cluster bacterium TaxID=2024889 RepID=A0A2A4T438_9DELT|nr:MAG: glutamate-5-semialdehyde dehydrogenase [SAR324 cluster bacterium]
MSSTQTSKSTVAQAARKISPKLSNLSGAEKDQLLLKISENLKNNKQRIIEANQKDVQAAQKMVDQGELSTPLLNRLILTDDKIAQLSTYLEEVAKLDDPIGKKQFAMKLAEGLELERISCPLGVVAIIFESRPEVVIQVTALSLKSGNAVILKGGREASHSNRVLFELIEEVLKEMDLLGAVNLIETRDDVANLLDQEAYIDLIIPRGGNEFVRYIQENTKIPVLGHSSGICHIYVDQQFDLAMATKVSVDAKVDYPSACNAVETILVHAGSAESFIPQLIPELLEKKVSVKGCARSLEIAQKNKLSMEAASEEDWESEYSDLVLSIKVVDSMQEAIEHINRHGSHHTDSIITTENSHAEFFLQQVDSACVFHNASTRFSDGYVFGLGAEVGISTNKTHARGPVGLDGMIIYKYLLRGDGQVRGVFSGKNALPFLHQALPID